jgi:CubicO group peptidase (beta-lactamase class C family)
MRLLACSALLCAIMTTSSNSADLSALMSGARVPGLSMAIVRDGEIVSRTAAGVRNMSSGDPVGEHTIFDAASLSKPVFAYVVMQLVDGGALSLDTQLSRYVPDYDWLDYPRYDPGGR